jgi:hypothetical protein
MGFICKNPQDSLIPAPELFEKLQEKFPAFNPLPVRQKQSLPKIHYNQPGQPLPAGVG